MFKHKKRILAAAVVSSAALFITACSNNTQTLPAATSSYDFNNSPKDASATTIEKNQGEFEKLQNLIVSQTDYKDPAIKSAGSLLCEYPYNIPTTQAPDRNDCTFTPADSVDPDEIYWPREDYDFLNEHHHPFRSTDSKYSEYRINPSLLRMAKLNNKAGIDDISKNAIEAGVYQAGDIEGKIYQVRGLDLAVMSFIWSPGDVKEGTPEGWIVVDPLTSGETARQGYQLFLGAAEIPNRDAPIRGIIFTHSHIDHFGGVAGLAPENCEDLTGYFAGKSECDGHKLSHAVEIIAPEEFFEHSVSENVMAGNIMSRRAGYMYGNIAGAGVTGSVDGGLGKITSAGSPALIPATEIGRDIKHKINGLTIDITMANGSEAPSEFMFYVEKYDMLMAAEVVTNTIHNISSMRGARTRDANAWVKYVDKVLGEHGDNSKLMIASHHWPTYGKDNIVEQLEKTRDMYKYVHDQALRLANKGYTPNEISNTVELPPSLNEEWYNHGYYGTVSHNARATYDFYLGAWWDGNPANLNPLSPADEGVRFIAAMGGIDNVINTGIAAVTSGEYRWAVRLLSHAVFGYNAASIEDYNSSTELTDLSAFDESKLTKVRYLAADAMEQMGYQAESGPWRNYYLGAAVELRQTDGGFPTLVAVDTTGISGNMPISMGLESLALLVNPDEFVQNYVVTFTVNNDIDGDWFGTYYLNLSNSTLKSYQNPYNDELHPRDLNSHDEPKPGYNIPGDTDEYKHINITATQSEMKQWIGEMFVNGDCSASTLCSDSGLDTFSEIFEKYPGEFGIATP
ncbi:alkyl/aryl-sulfatase [Sessilibacter corallicola]|uniref:alkyl/aryl-sulfatase n=1 Tax=Sessilibacter corallicola TaxID=2904075 RepID=UPI001E582870|nr:alkyl sulfatase dimerization domain-containing protein [Sessilibacter corallicola]MCE2029585.1 MBL fold metallo-hydrolase [Sessilibacter corallicola]